MAGDKSQMNDIVYPSTPFETFVAWMDLAAKNELNDFNAMTVSTVGKDGMPSSRVMLLKGYDIDGFIFYSGYNSHKGKQLRENPKASINFYWKSLRRQVTIEGLVAPLPEAESDTYFATRPRETQITTWASLQSEPLASDEVWKERIKMVEAEFKDREIPRPEFWGGFRLTPLRIEFWEDAPFRRYNRTAFLRPSPSDPWTKESLYP
jgi:pyridoxamine 5'-phosphate oxidase